MAASDFRVFISAVTSEFGKARDAVASDLRSKGLSVKEEDEFRLERDADTMLRKLHNYIRDCSAVVCIVGDRSGSSPTPIEAAPFAEMLPDGITQASFTQWEFFLARHFRRQLFLCVAKGHDPEGPALATDDPVLQQIFLQYIRDQGLNHEPFSTSDELRRKILKEDWTNARQPKPIVLPYPSIGDLFKGRDGFLKRLHESLGRGGPTAIVSHALYGLGGIGKTRAAVEYAWARQDDYSALLFVVAETPEALHRNLAALVGTLVPKLDTTDDVARLRAVLDWLKTNPGWFLILDNVDTKSALSEVERLLGGLSGGHVVVTSRLADFSANFRPLEMDVLGLDDAAAFLLARTDGRRRKAVDDDARAREVATELGQLALALEQAAAFIAKRRLTFGQYLEKWRSHRDEVLAWLDTTVTGYPRAVAITWQTSVTQLSEGGRRLLEWLAWLAPEKIPEFLLDVPVPAAEADNLHDALDDLAAYSLVTRDADGPFFLIHRLVQDVSRRSLTDETRYRRLAESLGWIRAAFSGQPTDVHNWPRLDPLASHANSVTTQADAADISEPTTDLMTVLAGLFYSKALHTEAEPLLSRALVVDEKVYGSNHPKVASRLNNFAQLLKATNRLAEAEPLMRRTLAIDEEIYGPDHPEVAIDLNNLARLFHDTNRLTEAEPILRRALAIDEKSYGPDHPEIASDLNNLAGLLIDIDGFIEAEPLLRRALAIDEKHYGPDHPKVAAELTNLSLLLKNTNRLPEAESLVRRALEIREKSYGPEHPEVAMTLNNLAQLLVAANRTAEAEPLLRRAITIIVKCFGADHPNVAVSFNNLALLLQRSGRSDEAEPLMRRHVEIFVEFTRKAGHQHPHLDAAFRNYANVLESLGKGPTEIDAEINRLKDRLTT